MSSIGTEDQSILLSYEKRFVSVWRKTEQDLRIFLKRHLPESDKVEDILQETVLAAWRNAETLLQANNPAAWLTRVAKNKLNDSYRSAYNRKEIATDATVMAETLTQEPDFHDQIFTKEDLDDGLRCLPPMATAAFFFRYCWGYSVRELAEIMGVPEGTLKYLFHFWRLSVKRRIRIARNPEYLKMSSEPDNDGLVDSPQAVLDELTIAYRPPDWNQVRARTFCTRQGLRGEIYYPPNYTPNRIYPIVIFAFCYNDAEIRRWFGGAMKDIEPYVSWAQAMASKGISVAAYSRQGPSSINDFLEFLRVNHSHYHLDPTKVAIYGCSGCAEEAVLAVEADRKGKTRLVKALVLYYPVFTSYTVPDHPDPALKNLKILIAKAGKENPHIVKRVDAFIAYCQNTGCTVEVVEHPAGHHGFEIFNRDEVSRQIIQMTLEALAGWLNVEDQ